MQTAPSTPLQIFNMPQYLEIPLFQRPYVWNLEDQWEPLWQDIRRMAELRLESPGTQARHFLGAVVFQASPQAVGGIQTSQVIDGQQRLTTLQIVFDAASLVLDSMGDANRSSQLRNLTHNAEAFIPSGDQALKLKHTNKDAAAFHEVMEAPAPIDYELLKHSGSRIVGAHAYFSDVIARWLGSGDESAAATRAEALARVLDSGLQVVTITLGSDENSQEIFETLNARGTPLTAADLIKNFVFQRLAAEGADTAHAYERIWPFDTKFWEKETSVGRYKVSRSSLFLNQWLTSRLGEEISPQSTFTRFKVFMEHDAKSTMKDILVEIREQAHLYQSWWENADSVDRSLDSTSMCFYRMSSLESQLLKPLLIWLHAPGRNVPQAQVDRTINIAESWMMRRTILRLATSDMGRVLADVIRGLASVDVNAIADHVENHLALLNVASTYWPGDGEVRRSLTVEPVYRRFSRKRLRPILEAIENSMRAPTSAAQVTRWNLPIEHVLPQAWEEHWPVASLEEQMERDAHVHRLGNLTLLTTSLNSKVSNNSWEVKRSALAEHDTLLLNSRLVASLDPMQSWDEAAIERRSTVMADAVLGIWPTPAGHKGEVVDARSRTSWTVTIRDLVVAGILQPGARLTFTRGDWRGREAFVRADGLIELDGKLFDTPSGAGKAIRGKATNGWASWLLDDGRRLDDVRAAYMGKTKAEERQGFDWVRVHAILAAIPEGSWTTFKDVADAAGAAVQSVTSHVMSCDRCENAHRVLRADGTVTPQFAWQDPSDVRDPEQVLVSEGVAFSDGVADPSSELDADALGVLAPASAPAIEGRGVFRLSLGANAANLSDALAGGYVGVDWMAGVDLSQFAGGDHTEMHSELNDVVKSTDGIDSEVGAGLAVGATWVVISQMQVGDVVLVPTGNSTYRVAVVAGPYVFAPGEAVPHRRAVDWLAAEIARADMPEDLRSTLKYSGTVQNISRYGAEVAELLAGH